jgi:5-deoxy-D-glucuronate isomerase
MEEFYYFRISAPEGWGLLKYYREDGEIDHVYTVRDNSLLKASRGYHTYVSTPTVSRLLTALTARGGYLALTTAKG